jgi:hypothetical protein
MMSASRMGVRESPNSLDEIHFVEEGPLHGRVGQNEVTQSIIGVLARCEPR